MTTRAIIALAALSILPGCATPGDPQRAADEGPTRWSQCARAEIHEVPVLDDTRELLEETLCTTALWLDDMLGDEGDVLAARRSHGQLELSARHSQFEGGDIGARLRVRVELPAFKQRLSAFVGLDDQDDFVRDRSEGFAVRSQFPSIDDREGWLAGLGYALPGSERFQSDFRIGARSLRRPKLFVQNRFAYNLYADDENLVHLRSTLFWTNRDGFGVTAGYDINHVLSATRLLRWDTVGTVSEKSMGLDWRSALIHYHNLRRKRGLAYQAFIHGLTTAPEPLREYGLLTIYRHPVFRERLFAELALSYSWPRVDPLLPREGSLGAGITLELPFGSSK